MTLLICWLFVLRSALPARVAATTPTVFQLLVFQLQSCCRLREWLRIIVAVTGPIVHSDPARPLPCLRWRTWPFLVLSPLVRRPLSFLVCRLRVPRFSISKRLDLQQTRPEGRCIGLHLFQVSGPWPEGSRRKMSPYWRMSASAIALLLRYHHDEQ